MFLCVKGAYAIVGSIDHREYVNWADYPNVLQFGIRYGNGIDSYCTAQYVGGDLVLTAAHCLDDGRSDYAIKNNNGDIFDVYLENKGRYNSSINNDDWALLRVKNQNGFSKKVFYKPKVLSRDAVVSSIGFGALRILSDEEIKLLNTEIRQRGCKDRIRSCLKEYDDFLVNHGYDKISSWDADRLKADKNCRILVNTDCFDLCYFGKSECKTTCRERNITISPEGQRNGLLASTCDTWGGNSGGPYIDNSDNTLVAIVESGIAGYYFGDNAWNYATSSKNFYTALMDAQKQSPQINEPATSKDGQSCDSADLPEYATNGKYIVKDGKTSCYATECKDGTYLAVKKGDNDEWVSHGYCVTDKYCGDGKVLNIINNKQTDLQCDEKPRKKDDLDKLEPIDKLNGLGNAVVTSDEPKIQKPPVSISTSMDSVIADNVSSQINLQSFINVNTEDKEDMYIKYVNAKMDVLQQKVDTGMENISEQSDEAILFILSDMIEYNKLDELRKKYEEAKAREQSLENRTLGAVSIGATGIGGMMAASALAEQKSDADAERSMRAYLETFTCEYGGGKHFKNGETNIELPGGNDMVALYTEYATLANDLKLRKELLGIVPGIESDVVVDKADTALYDNAGVGITGGVYASIARAIMNPDGEDAAKWNAQKDKTAQNLKIGAITAAAGIVTGIVGNQIINGKNKVSELSESEFNQFVSEQETIQQHKSKIRECVSEKIKKGDTSSVQDLTRECAK